MTASRLFDPLYPERIQGLSPLRLRRCTAFAVARRDQIQAVLHMTIGTDHFEGFKRGIAGYSELISRVEVEISRRAIEAAMSTAPFTAPKP